MAVQSTPSAWGVRRDETMQPPPISVVLIVNQTQRSEARNLTKKLTAFRVVLGVHALPRIWPSDNGACGHSWCTLQVHISGDPPLVVYRAGASFGPPAFAIANGFRLWTSTGPWVIRRRRGKSIKKGVRTMSMWNINSAYPSMH